MKLNEKLKNYEFNLMDKAAETLPAAYGMDDEEFDKIIDEIGEIAADLGTEAIIKELLSEREVPKALIVLAMVRAGEKTRALVNTVVETNEEIELDYITELIETISSVKQPYQGLYTIMLMGAGAIEAECASPLSALLAKLSE